MKRALRKVLTLPRWVSFPVVVGSLVCVIALCYPGGLSAAYADLRDSNKLNATVNECRAKEEKMGGRMSGLRERIDYKEGLVAALIQGQATLTAVTDQFAEMNRGDEHGLYLQRARFGNVPDTELAALNVLDYVRLRLENDDSSSSVVQSRLNAEFEQRFGHTAPQS